MNKDEVPLKSIQGGVQMDVTERYILMNKKADEIQKLLNQGVRLYGTPFWYNNTLIRILAGEVFYFADFNETKKETIWLPTQDQLQRILKLEIVPLVDNFCFFFRLVDFSDFNTLEQLWLDFVMRNKFDKKWNHGKKEWESIQSGDSKLRIKE